MIVLDLDVVPAPEDEILLLELRSDSTELEADICAELLDVEIEVAFGEEAVKLNELCSCELTPCADVLADFEDEAIEVKELAELDETVAVEVCVRALDIVVVGRGITPEKLDPVIAVVFEDGLGSAEIDILDVVVKSVGIESEGIESGGIEIGGIETEIEGIESPVAKLELELTELEALEVIVGCGGVVLDVLDFVTNAVDDGLGFALGLGDKSKELDNLEVFEAVIEATVGRFKVELDITFEEEG